MGRFMTCLLTRQGSQSTPRFQWNPKDCLRSDTGTTTHAVYRDYKVFWVLLKVLGMFPYHINENGDVMFSWMSKEMGYSILVHGAISVPVLMVLRLRYYQRFQWEGNFDHVICLYLSAFLMMPHLVIPFSHWCEIPRFQSAFMSWRRFQACYEDVLKKKLWLGPYWSPNVFVLFIVIMTYVAIIIKFFAASTEYTWELVAHIYIISIVIIHEFLLIGLCSRLVRMARKLRTQVLLAVQADDILLVGQLSTLWINLSEVTGLVGTLFYRMYAHIFIMLFAISTLTMYYLFQFFTRNFWTLGMLYHLAFLTSNLLWIYFICECGERVSNEVGHKFALQLSKIKSSVKNHDMKYELDSFLCAISSFPPTITLNGFVTINRRLYVSLKSTMVTYLIVVLQFSQDYSSPESDVISSSNSYNCSS